MREEYSQPNEIQELVDAVTCDALLLETDLSTAGGFAQAETLVELSESDINIDGVYTYAIDEMAGELADVVYNGTTYQIPLIDAPTDQIRLECSEDDPPDEVTNEIQELIDAVTCDILFLETGLSTSGGFAQAETVVMLSLTDINIDGYYTYAIDTLLGTTTDVTFGGTTYQIPLINAPTDQIRLECEIAISMDLPVLDERYEELLLDLGWDGDVLPISEQFNLVNSCSELRYQTGGIDLPIKFIVQIESNTVVNYGVELNDGTITTQHWVVGFPDGELKNLVFAETWHTSRYDPFLPGNTLMVDIVCQ